MAAKLAHDMKRTNKQTPTDTRKKHRETSALSSQETPPYDPTDPVAVMKAMMDSIVYVKADKVKQRKDTQLANLARKIQVEERFKAHKNNSKNLISALEEQITEKIPN